jgi:hypothetical protein
MFDINVLTTAAVIVLGMAMWVVLTRIMGDADPVELTAMFGQPWELDWPRGVQEEEPFHWRLDRIAPVPGAAVRLRSIEPLEECAECADEVAA